MTLAYNLNTFEQLTQDEVKEIFRCYTPEEIEYVAIVKHTTRMRDGVAATRPVIHLKSGYILTVGWDLPVSFNPMEGEFTIRRRWGDGRPGMPLARFHVGQMRKE